MRSPASLRSADIRPVVPKGTDVRLVLGDDGYDAVLFGHGVETRGALLTRAELQSVDLAQMTQRCCALADRHCDELLAAYA